MTLSSETASDSSRGSESTTSSGTEPPVTIEDRVAAAEAQSEGGRGRRGRGGSGGGDNTGGAPRWGRGRQRVAHPAAWPWRWIFPLVTLAAVVAIPVLTSAATKAVLDSTAGVQAIEITDPTAEGFIALVSPTPSFLAIHVDDGDVLVGATLLTVKGGDEDVGGTVVVFPAEFLTTPAGIESPEPIHLSYTDGGAERVVDGLSRALGTKPQSSFEVIPPSLWYSLITPVEGFEYSIIDDLNFVSADGSVGRLAAGVAEVRQEEVLIISSALDNEPGIARATRIERLWQAWIQAIKSSGDDELVGPGSSTLKTFVERIAAGTSVVQAIPAEPFRVDGRSQPLYVGRVDEIDELRNTIIPFILPIEPGAAPVVEVVNGTGDVTQNAAAIDEVVRAGGLLSVVSNAQVFGVSTSRVHYYNSDDLEFVEDLAERLGGLEVRLFEVEDTTVDVVVTLGSDYRPEE